MPRVMLTGSSGYVGSVVKESLKAKGFEVVEIDLQWFSSSSSSFSSHSKPRDFADLNRSDFLSVDALIHLAAVSNDPMGAEFDELTQRTNFTNTLRLIKQASECGIPKFIFASSCSVYGDSAATVADELAPLRPLTKYAQTKSQIETEISELARGPSNATKFIALRFATACGPSPSFRVDLVLNDLIWSALETGTISLSSDGSPIRPLIDVRDMAWSIEWSLGHSPESLFEVFNVGQSTHNFSVLEIAKLVQRVLPTTRISLGGESNGDTRSYTVDFGKFEAASGFIARTLESTVKDTAEQLRDLRSLGVQKDQLVRLWALRQLKTES